MCLFRPISHQRRCEIGRRTTPPTPRDIRWGLSDRQPRVWNVTDEIHLVSFDEDSYYQDPAGFFARLRESRPITLVRTQDYGRA